MILAANHRSFLDPFVIGCCLRPPDLLRRQAGAVPNRLQGWLLNCLGAFPVRRGESDEESVETALGLLDARRGRGHLPRGHPHPHAARSASPSAASAAWRSRAARPVVPIAVTGTERARRGWLDPPGEGDASAAAARSPSRAWSKPSPDLAARGDRAHLALRGAPVGVARRPAAAAHRRRRRRRLDGHRDRRAARARRARGPARLPHGRPGRAPGRRRARTSATCRASQLDDGIARLHGGRHRVRRRRPGGVRRALPSPSRRAWPRWARRSASAASCSWPRRASSPPLGTTPTAYVAERVRARAVAYLGGPAHAREAVEERRLGRARHPRPRRRAASSRTCSSEAGLQRRAHRRPDRRRAGRLREERRGARRGRRRARAAPTWPARPPGASSPRCTSWRSAAAAAARPSPAWPGAGDLVATDAGRGQPQPARRASWWARACRPSRSPRCSARPPRRWPPSRCSSDALERERRRGAGDRPPARRARRPRLAGRVARERPGVPARDAAPPEAARSRLRRGWPSVTDKPRLDRDFTELYRAHLRDVYSYSYYRVGNHHDAEDLTEQTFLQAYRHFERAQRESNGRPLRPWLIRIAHNLAANYYRDRSRRPQTHLEDAGVLDGHPRHRGPGRGARGGAGGARRAWRSYPTTGARR